MVASLPISIWLMKFSTDELLIAPGAMGVIIMIARLWDGVSDPLAGHLSDSTRSRFGRRHVWMLGAALFGLDDLQQGQPSLLPTFGDPAMRAAAPCA